MPSIYDNLLDETRLGPALQGALAAFDRMDVATGYLDLRGWSNLADLIDAKTAAVDQLESPVARVLIGKVMPSDAQVMLARLQETVQTPAYGSDINSLEKAIRAREQLGHRVVGEFDDMEVVHDEPGIG